MTLSIACSADAARKGATGGDVPQPCVEAVDCRGGVDRYKGAGAGALKYLFFWSSVYQAPIYSLGRTPFSLELCNQSSCLSPTYIQTSKYEVLHLQCRRACGWRLCVSLNYAHLSSHIALPLVFTFMFSTSDIQTPSFPLPFPSLSLQPTHQSNFLTANTLPPPPLPLCLLP